MAVSLAIRRVRLLLVYAACLLPLIVFGAFRVLSTNHNSPFEWVPRSFAPRQDYEDFRSAFGSGEVLIVSWPACTVDSRDLELLTSSLRRVDFFKSPAGEPYIEQVVTGQEALRGLMADPLKLSREKALARIKGTLVGPDGQTTCAVVTFTPAGLRDRANVVGLIRAGLADYCHAPRSQQHFAGPVIDGLSVDEASNDSLNRFALPSTLVVFAICWWWLRWLPGALLVVAVSAYCEGATLALIHWCGGEMTALLIVLPPLVQVVTASGGIHLINYYLVAAQSYDGESAAWGAVKIGWLPCTLSAVTNAIGLGSLCVSQLLPVRMFGLYGAMGVMLTLAAVITFIPGVLSIWKPKGIARAARLDLETGAFEGHSRFWSWLSRGVARHHAVIVGVSVLLMAGFGWGLRGLSTSVHVRTLFDKGTRIIADYTWIEQHVGSLVPLELVIDFSPRAKLGPADRYGLVKAVQQQLARTEHVRGTVSCANLMPNFLDDAQADPAEVRKLLPAVLEEARPHFVSHHYLNESATGEQWRVTAYVSALDEIDYGEMLSTIRGQLEAIGATDNAAAGIAFRVTGVMPLVHQIQRALMQDLFISFLSAFAIIYVVMTVVQAGFATAAVAMIPNFFPTVIMFGLLGYLHWPLDIGSVMTASVALGIAIDDVLHFLTFYRRGLARGLSREEAVHATYQQCGFAMFVSSVVCGVGPIVFVFSDFLPASRFAWMMLSLLTLAVLGDMVLLPALVTGPFGRLFERQHERAKPDATDAATVGRQAAPAITEPSPASPQVSA